jgi:hypothetical protein
LKVNQFQKLNGVLTNNNNLVLLFETEPTIETASYIQQLLSNLPKCQGKLSENIIFEPQNSRRAIEIPILVDYTEIELMNNGGKVHTNS